MHMVSPDLDLVDRELRAGRLSCPLCEGRLRPWGWARQRLVRHLDQSERLRPRRSRCAGCAVTHVLMPVVCLLRRVDAVAVIGAALLAKATGQGHRPIAARLGRPATTVRDWLRRFAARAEALRALFTALALRLDPDLTRRRRRGRSLLTRWPRSGWRRRRRPAGSGRARRGRGWRWRRRAGCCRPVRSTRVRPGRRWAEPTASTRSFPEPRRRR